MSNTKVNRSVTRLKRDIQSVLSYSGIYAPALALQIETLARDMTAYRMVSNEFFSLKEITVKEKSREGNERTGVHPLGNEMRMWSDTVRRDLSKLTMNIKDNKKKEAAEDEFSKLMKSFQEDDDEEE